MTNQIAWLLRPATLAGILGTLVAILWLMPTLSGFFPTAVELQEWLRTPIAGTNANRAEVVFAVAVFMAAAVSGWNWVDAALDFRAQNRKREKDTGDYLAARASFRRESYRIWRTSSMLIVALALLFNWQFSTLYFTFGFLIFAYSEAVNSALDRLYRQSAYASFAEERVRRQRLIEMARAERRKVTMETEQAATDQRARIELALAENTAMTERAAIAGEAAARQSDRAAGASERAEEVSNNVNEKIANLGAERQEQNARIEATVEDTNKRMQQVVRDIVTPQDRVAADPDAPAPLTVGEQIEETHALASDALRTAGRAEESAGRAEDSARDANIPTTPSGDTDGEV